MNTDFDPIDLVALTTGLCQQSETLGKRLDVCIEDAETLIQLARMLDRLYDEVGDDWPGVFAYEVSEPLGQRLAHLRVDGERIATVFDQAEAIARELIAEGG